MVPAKEACAYEQSALLGPDPVHTGPQRGELCLGPIDSAGEGKREATFAQRMTALGSFNRTKRRRFGVPLKTKSVVHYRLALSLTHVKELAPRNQKCLLIQG